MLSGWIRLNESEYAWPRIDTRADKGERRSERDKSRPLMKEFRPRHAMPEVATYVPCSTEVHGLSKRTKSVMISSLEELCRTK